jgi:hypothetical protein
MKRNLLAEMYRRGVKVAAIAEALSINEKTVRNKIQGYSAFTFPEAEALRDTFFPEENLEYLLQDEPAAPAATSEETI